MPHSERITSWFNAKNQRCENVVNAWLDVSWKGHDLEVLMMYFADNQYRFIIGPTHQIVADFFNAVCTWNTEVHSEVLVFE